MTGGEELITKYATEQKFESETAFARFLHEIEPTRSVDGWRGAILRWKRKGGQITYTVWNGHKKNPRLMQNPSPELASAYAIEPPKCMKAYFDSDKDVYLTFIPQSNHIVEIDGDKHRLMKKKYSDGGGRFTVAQMATEFGFPILWMQEYIKAHEWKHPMSPYTDEELTEKSEDELVYDYLEMKRTAALERAKRTHYATMARDANKWRNLDDTFYNEFKLAIHDKHLPPKSVKKIKMDTATPYALVISPTDLHFGSSAWIDETGNHYDTQEARERLMDRTHNLISRMPGRPEKIYLATGSDWFHVDNDTGGTTKGTPQDMSVSPSEMFMDGCMLAQEHIELLRSVCPVEVVCARGNHDRHLALALMMYLKASYDKIKDVDVIVDPNIRQYASYGNTLLGFTHGDGVKGMDLPSLMAKEEWKEWGQCEHKIWFHGHLHHQSVLEKGGAMVIQLPSLAGNDRWHHRKGYILSRPGLSAHLIDKDMGLIGHLFAPVKE